MKRTSWDRLQGQYHLIRDCLDGEDAVKDQGQLYVPKPDGMSVQNYTHYLDRACFYGAPEMTLRALVGLALRKDAVIKLPPRLEPMRLNATYENAPMQVLVENMVREVATMGRFGILLDLAWWPWAGRPPLWSNRKLVANHARNPFTKSGYSRLV
jgi:hypothetical protein